jgi:hypothetical protein
MLTTPGDILKILLFILVIAAAFKTYVVVASPRPKGKIQSQPQQSRKKTRDNHNQKIQTTACKRSSKSSHRPLSSPYTHG